MLREVYFYIFLGLAGFPLGELRHRKGVPNGKVKLEGGDTPGAGNVLIFNHRRWGAICDDGWNIESANVVCRKLNYSHAIKHTVQAEFGLPSREIWLDNVQCTGDESNLLDCNHNEWGIHDCLKREAAGVVCATGDKKENEDFKNQTYPHNDTQYHSNPTIIFSSTVEEETMEETAHGVDMQRDALNVFGDTKIDSHQEEESLYEKTQEEQENIVEREGTGSVEKHEKSENDNLNHLDLITESVTEKTMPPKIEQEIEDKKESLIDLDDLKEDTNRIESPLHNSEYHHTPPNYDLRVVNGRNVWEGRVEINIDGEWGTICGDTWGTLEAMVACRQAGLQYAQTSVKVDYFQGKGIDKLVSGIKCDGNEDRLSECYHGVIGDVICPSDSMVAGVVCTNKLPDLVPNATLIEHSTYLQDVPMYYLQCAMEENCASASAYTIKENSADWQVQRRRLLRFSSSTWNFGTADFRPFAPREQWEWHNCHMHYHSMGVFAHYDLLDGHGNRVAEGHKASFCLEDVQCLTGITKRYQCKGYAQQGISAGCADDYLHDIDCQWIDITDVPPGNYIFKVVINPDYSVSELNFNNNAVTCNLQYTTYQVFIHGCTLGPK